MKCHVNTRLKLKRIMCSHQDNTQARPIPAHSLMQASPTPSPSCKCDRCGSVGGRMQTGTEWVKPVF
ncbi:hypothetical protein E2C01_036198 [Portunus trituberculatus]|uniref:Uncharacterized protein n=1 Tax=Portunus trituberculatus TaxID=210409 RepID=A0A5B7FAP5_PORTR|nr:hypothetical protein [Portunus trituberculatus]